MWFGYHSNSGQLVASQSNRNIGEIGTFSIVILLLVLLLLLLLDDGPSSGTADQDQGEKGCTQRLVLNHVGAVMGRILGLMGRVVQGQVDSGDR